MGHKLVICRSHLECSLGQWVKWVIRFESGSDDLDNLGHLGHVFDGSSWSHPQTKFLDITCPLENSVGIW